MTAPTILPHRSIMSHVIRAQTCLGMTHEMFGSALGSSQRTSARWAAGQSFPSVPQLRKIAALVYPVDPSIAKDLAVGIGETLLSLGLELPPVETPAATVPVPPPLPLPLVVDSVICAAAEAMNQTPQLARIGVLAAFLRAKALGLGMNEVITTLSEAEVSGRT